MINEEISRRIDSAGRISIPKHLRKKYGCTEGVEVEFYTTQVDGQWFICISPVEEEEEYD
jgi:AbrB family looped-hinge helix DNA binding protein